MGKGTGSSVIIQKFTVRDLIFVGDKVDTIDALASHSDEITVYQIYISFATNALWDISWR